MSNVLIVAPHPDDETLGCGGTILKHIANKDKVSWLIMTKLTNELGYNDKEIKKILRDTDGLGTDATRAGIIDLLFKRGFLSRQGKKIIASETGVALINALPMQATLPDMTAQWEASLTAISHKSASYLSFMNPLISAVVDMVNGASEQQFSGLPKVAFKPKRKRWYSIFKSKS